MSRRLYVYEASSLDGVNDGLVAAHNLKEAADLFNTTVGQLRAYGYRRTDDEEKVRLATAKPGTVFYRRILDRGPWSESRSR